MKRLHSRGHINSLFLPLLLCVITLMATVGFAAWAFLGRQDFKNNVDKKIASAVQVAETQTATAKDNEFLEKEKSPVKTYTGPQTFGSLTFTYPKTWSALVTEDAIGSSSASPVNGYFYPDYLPGVGIATISYALRVRVLSASYDKTVATYNGGINSGKTKATPFTPAKMSGIVGVRFDGDLLAGKQGISIVLPLRDKSIEIWTESNQYASDFETYILPSLTYVP